MTEIANWSGSIRFRPRRFAEPRDATSLGEEIRDAASRGETVRVMGSAHSSSPIFATPDRVVSLKHFTGLIEVDTSRGQATLGAATTLEEAGRLLYEHGLALANIGDIDQQTLAGVIGTGTHGTGRSFGNLAGMLIGGSAVDGRGALRSFDDARQEVISALRVSLGALGVLTQVRLQLQPTRWLYRREWCSQADDFLPHLEETLATNRHADFYWYPRSDRVKLRTVNTFDGPRQLPFATRVEFQEGWTHQVIAQRRELRFEECEYAIPAEAGPECFRRIRDRVKSVHRHYVGWRVLYRTVSADKAFLSPHHARDSVTISVLQNATLPYEDYFRDIEAIFHDYAGRPHWGKKHHLAARELSLLYPQWDAFQRIREDWDPPGVFLSEPLRRLLLLAR